VLFLSLFVVVGRFGKPQQASFGCFYVVPVCSLLVEVKQKKKTTTTFSSGRLPPEGAETAGMCSAD
jgi:hypothetical protein